MYYMYIILVHAYYLHVHVPLAYQYIYLSLFLSLSLSLTCLFRSSWIRVMVIFFLPMIHTYRTRCTSLQLSTINKS